MYRDIDSNDRMSELIERARESGVMNNIGNVSFEPEELNIAPPAALMEMTNRDAEYQARSLKLLEEIKNNTGNLYTIVNLIRESNDTQEEILDVLMEVFAIATAKDKAEADSFFKKAVAKINETVHTAESIAKLMSLATVCYEMISNMFS